MYTTTIDDNNYTQNSSSIKDQWRALGIYNIFRCSLATFFLLVFYLNLDNLNLGSRNPVLTQMSLMLYIGFSIAVFFIVAMRRVSLRNFILTSAYIDILLLIVLIYSSEGVTGALGLMINIILAGNCILLSGRLALFFAAFAVTLLFTQHLLAEPEELFAASQSLLYASLGLSYFATAALASALSRRLKDKEQVAEQSVSELHSLQRLNKMIIEKLSSGIIVIDLKGKICFINDVARRYFHLPEVIPSEPLAVVAPTVAEHVKQWQRTPYAKAQMLRTTSGVQLETNIMPLGSSGAAILIFLDDITQLAQQAQEMKLASLGQFTASIAHELRNPLGAISHASQLLSETTTLGQQEQRLLEIILTHTDRMNIVIKNILNLSRRTTANPIPIVLEPWLNNFINHQQIHICDARQFELHLYSEQMVVMMDPSQLHQVLSNLIENSVRACASAGITAHFHVYLGYNNQEMPYLELKDNGPGIDEKNIEKLFEPFFTTHAQGTGLGLYIANDLCQANGARLEYIPQESGACFRITFKK